jgi:hypothetical protein
VATLPPDSVGWPAVPGADHYRMLVFSLGNIATIDVPGASGQVQQLIPLGISGLAGTVEGCGRRGFGVAVTPIDACGTEGPTSGTGINCIP